MKTLRQPILPFPFNSFISLQIHISLSPVLTLILEDCILTKNIKHHLKLFFIIYNYTLYLNLFFYIIVFILRH